MYNGPYSYPTLTNSTLWNDSAQGEPLITYSDMEDGYTGAGNIDADPLFINAAANNFEIANNSPVVDSGNNAAVPEGVTTDIAGNNRFQDIVGSAHRGSGSIPIVDMGAYEAQSSRRPFQARTSPSPPTPPATCSAHLHTHGI